MKTDVRSVCSAVCLALWGVFWPFYARAATELHILLQDSPLAGFQYHQGKAVWAEIRAGDGLALVREPDNRYDGQAIRVEWRGLKLGYVPRRENADVARMMDNGARLEARVTRLTESRDPWQRIRFEILAPVK